MAKRKPLRPARESAGLAGNASLNKAFELAHSIYRFRAADRKLAVKVVVDALASLDVRLMAQLEADRHDPSRPSKVRWSTTQWFQLLILAKSCAYEQQQEKNEPASLSADDMIIRYLKHLILMTYRRNSFHVSLGISRLVYAYTAAEAMAIYDLVFQDPDSSTRKSDAYYRSRKTTLIEEIRKRFHRFLRIEEGPRGERRFELEPDSLSFNELVIEYLTRLTPWNTECGLPNRIDTFTHLPSLQASQPAQIHALVDPPCFSGITRALKMDPPATRLALPKFFLSSISTPDDGAPSALNDEETERIRRSLRDEQKRRKRFSSDSLSVLGDGVELTRIDLASAANFRIEIDPSTALLEIVGNRDGENCLLASHLLTYQEEGTAAADAIELSIVLEGGQKVLVSIGPIFDSHSTTPVQISYTEAKSLRRPNAGREFIGGLFTRTTAGKVRHGRVRALAVASALVIFILIAIGLYLSLTRNADERIARLEPTPSPSTTATHKPSPAETREVASASTPRKAKTPVEEPKAEGGTREQTERAVKSLSEVTSIYVEIAGPDPFAHELRQQLTEKIRTMGGLEVVSTPDAAGTAIHSSIRSTNPNEHEVATVQLTLVNSRGALIWQSKAYRGSASEAADQFVKDLRAAIATSRKRRNDN